MAPHQIDVKRRSLFFVLNETAVGGELGCAIWMQLTTQQGITAGLEADQAAKLAHIETVNMDAAAMRERLEQQTQKREAAEGASAAAHAKLSDHGADMTGEPM